MGGSRSASPGAWRRPAERHSPTVQIEALPFVNWIFWATLTSGSLLVVGLSELLGGTTRGYRLFMAGLLGLAPLAWRRLAV